MFNILEQPWTLLGLSVLVLFGVLTYRSVTDNRYSWQWLLPISCAVLAFGLDYLVKTDYEKIRSVLDTGLRAVVARDVDTIGKLIAEDYSDSYHRNKADFLSHARNQLSPAVIQSARKTASLIQISGNKAKVTLFILLILDKNSSYAQFLPIVKVKVIINLQKQPDSNWLVNQIEVSEVNNQPVSWSQAQ
jgi:hypothetical protein